VLCRHSASAVNEKLNRKKLFLRKNAIADLKNNFHALCHTQALVIRQRVFVFQTSLFAAQPDEELWRRMNTGAEQQGEGIIGNKKLT